MKDYNKLIPELSNWNNGKGIDILSWIGCVGDYEKAIGYSIVFWPEFIAVEDLIVREGTKKDDVKKWLDECKGERKKTEALINHLHIRDIQYWNCPGATPERLSYLGQILKEIYECKLKKDFPKREFVVELQEGNEDDLDGFMLTFYQR
jgi:hypothetical protein